MPMYAPKELIESKKKLDVEMFESRIEPLGVDSVDFALEDATYVRIQIIVAGKIKKIPTDLVEDLAKIIRNYDVRKNYGRPSNS